MTTGAPAEHHPRRRPDRREWTCAWVPFHDMHEDKPFGPSCGAPATHLILWLDGSGRQSPACPEHLDIDSSAPPHTIMELLR